MEAEKRIACRIALALAIVGAVSLAVFVGLLVHPAWGFFAALTECAVGCVACLYYVASGNE